MKNVLYPVLHLTSADTGGQTAGGQAVDSHMQRMLEVVPEHIHDRSGIFLGSYDEVQKVIDVHKKYSK
jgi:fructose-1,6-bisphosphatase I